VMERIPFLNPCFRETAKRGNAQISGSGQGIL
jgi:hypothetical protein